MALKYRGVTKEEKEGVAKEKKKCKWGKKENTREEKGNDKKRRRWRDRPQCTQSRRQINERRKNESVTVMYHRHGGGLVRKALRKGEEGKRRNTLINF